MSSLIFSLIELTLEIINAQTYKELFLQKNKNYPTRENYMELIIPT